jgi:malonyl CoA-acyl carrier protein transacylase
MSNHAHRAVAVVGVGAILPDAPDVATFWQNIKQGRYSISEVDPERWDPADYYDPDPNVPDKTYCKIGGWVREYEFEPFKWHMPIPPKVQAAMDQAQKWAIAASRAALLDFGYPDRALDTSRTAVILGNAMAGEYHYITNLRIFYPEYAHALESVPAFKDLLPDVQAALLDGMGGEIRTRISDITEDTMPGELANIIAGRVANALNLHGLNFVTDAACASSFAALSAAVEGLVSGHFDAVLTGGIDRNMGPPTFVKFCKIGALSPDGSRPFAEGANGFVMGEGAAIFLLKRLADAERDGDRIYAVIRGMGGASDGKGKGITAPNPIGQQKAIQRGWKMAGLSPAHASYIEGHGTSTRVGDVIEVESMALAFAPFDLPRGSIPLGSVKSNIGHLKGAAGAAAMLKTVLALHERVIPPTINFHRPNPSIDFESLPFYVNTDLRPWNHHNGDGVRRAGVSSFGFGGTNFHVVLEEHVPGMLTSRQRVFQGTEWEHLEPKAPYRGVLVLGASNVAGLQARLKVALSDAETGSTPSPQAPSVADLQARERLAIDYGNADELAKRSAKAVSALETDAASVWKPLASQGVYRGSGSSAGKVAFMFPGQGSQYANMLRELCDLDPVVAETFGEADEVMTPLLDRPLTEYIFCDADDKAAIQAAEDKLKDTTITQPAVLAVNVALTRLLATYGVVPDIVIGHSLGEYAALVAAGVLSFAEALHVVSARGREMTKVSVEDNGAMAAIFAPLEEVERILATVVGYVVLANINSSNQVVIGGSTKAVDEAIAAFQAADYRAVKLNVSHAFHTRIVAPASEPLKQVIARMDVRTPRLPVVANVTGELYPTAPNEIVDLLGRHIASPVQFVKGIQTMYREGARIFVEVGPKRVLKALTEDILGERDDVTVLFTNHPRKGALPSLNEALCGLYAAGVVRQDKLSDPGDSSPTPGPSAGTQPQRQNHERETTPMTIESHENAHAPGADGPAHVAPQTETPSNAIHNTADPTLGADRLLALGQLFASFLEQGQRIYQGMGAVPAPRPAAAVPSGGRQPLSGSVVISGAALGLPGQDGKVFDDSNVERLLRGEQFIELIPYRIRTRMAEKRINRLVKSANGASFEIIDDPARTIKLAGRGGYFDLAAEFGVPDARIEALDISTQLAIGAGIEALRDAGIPLVMRYRTTSKGTYLPDRWMLPEALADETGVIFASAFPGLDRMADETNRFHQFRSLKEQLKTLTQLRALVRPGDNGLATELDRRISNTQDELIRLDYKLDRRFIFRVLAMGHSQFAEYIGARGPNTHVNAACATTTQAIAVAEDWIRAGRCRRAIVVAGDDVTSENLMEWIGSGLLATGATTTEERLDKAALPFDRRRHGTIIGMGAAAVVIEAEDAIRERGMRGICEILSSQIANSAFHGTRLDVEHICEVMDRVVGQAEERFGIDRQQIAPQTVFVSHETYTPARGGSASAEIHALRQTFGERASQVVIANTKGYTGHAMGVGIEDVLAIKSLEHGTVPAVANINNDFQPDPDLGDLNLSRGGRYPVQYALRLGAGFGSQIAMTLLRKIPGDLERIEDRQTYDRWLSDMAGHDHVELEVEDRTLRIRDAGPPTRPPARSTWRHGRGPIAWASTPSTSPPREGIAKQVLPVPLPPPPIPAPAAPVQTPVPPAQSIAPPAAVSAASAPATPPAVLAAPSTVLPGAAASVAEQILGLVSEKTGYPPDMLDMDLDLEADLGIDTVKQAEVFATIRETYDIPRRDDLQLRDYNTLAKVVGFVHEMRPDLASTAVSAAPGMPETEQAAAPALPAAPAPVLPGAAASVAEQILALVSEKTGYPSDMLDMDLDLEADLGIDTVKQAEVFATIRETYDIPRRDDLQLRDYNTLAKVVGFVHEMRPDRASAVAGAGPATPPAPTVAATSPALSATPAPVLPCTAASVAEQILALVSEKTGYPSDMLDMDLDLEADLGIDTVKQAEVFATIRETYDIPRQEDLQLRDYNTLAKVVGFVHEMRPDLASAVAATSPALPAAPSTVLPGAADPVAGQILALVSEKTGYPSDMLDMDLDLEADLGIDTVKQAEVFATIRETYDIPRQEDLQLRDYNTLAKVVGFVHEMRGDVAPAATPPSPAGAGTEDEGGPSPVPPLPVEAQMAPTIAPTAGLEAANALPRRVPVPMLRPDLELCKPTGVEFSGDSRVIVVSDEGKAARYLGYRLRARKTKVLIVKDATPETVFQEVQAWQQEGPIDGVYFLPALDIEPPLIEMNLAQWRTEQEKRIKTLYALMRALPEDAFLISGTRLGGLHGYGPEGATAPLGGAVTGFTKSYARERPDALVKALDFDVDADDRQIAEILVNETLRDPGAVEIGYHGGQRYTVGLVEQPVAGSEPDVTLDVETVFVITGSAGGITARIVGDLARASGGTFYLTDLGPAPDPEDPDLARLEGEDLKWLKRDIAQRIKEGGTRPTPVMVERELAALGRAASVVSAMKEIERVGGTAHYRTCDVTDADAVHALIKEVKRDHGKVDVLVHAAGLERSHFLPDKPPQEFNLIFDVKADGFFNLLKATHALECPLHVSVVFTSIAGRFGNAGQTDYSAANDLLCKVTSSLRTTRPGTKAVAIDWSAWAGVGMATRRSIPEMMRRAGIDMLDPESAVPVVRREAITGGTGGEVLIAGALGILLDGRDPDGGIDLELANERIKHAFPVAGQVTAVDVNAGFTFEAELDPQAEPFLHDHALGDTPLLPGVMGVEGFAEIACLIASKLGSAKTSYRVASIEDVDFQAPLKFYRNEPRKLTWRARAVPEGTGLATQVVLESVRELKTGTQQTQHFFGRVHLEPVQDGEARQPTADAPGWNGSATLEPDAIYRVYFHGPAFQVLEGVQSDGERVVGKFRLDLPPMTGQPRETLVAPLLIELCLQTAGVWEIGKTGTLALPTAIEQVILHRTPENNAVVYAEIEPRPGVGDELGFDARVVDAEGNLYIELKGYRTARLPAPIDEEHIAPLRALVGGKAS